MARSVKPFGPRIAEARNVKGWAQHTLAKYAGVSLRTVERCEVSSPIDKAKFRMIVEALVGRLHEPNLEEELLPFKQFDAKREDDPARWLALAKKCDDHGDARHAMEYATMVVEGLEPTHPIYAEACVRLATFLDHLRKYDKAIRVANRVIALGPKRLRDGSDYHWALYHRGIARRRKAEYLRSRTWELLPAVRQLLDEARADFTEVLASNDARHGFGARHQLAVLDLLLGMYPVAIAGLEEALRLRQEAYGAWPRDPETRTRHAFECRRLGQCHAHLYHQGGDRKERQRAKDYFKRAAAMAEGNERLLKEIEDDVAAFGPGMG